VQLGGNGRESTFEPELWAEQLFDRVIEIDAARLKLRAHSVIDPVC
jgi:hypothetical protein